jgi:hypothetical protein
MIAIDMPSAQYLAQIAPALDALRLKVDLGVLNCTDQRSAYGNSHGAWGCCYRRPAPFPTWAEAEGTGHFGLAQATSGAVVRTAVVVCRPLPHDSSSDGGIEGAAYLGCGSRESVQTPQAGPSRARTRRPV